MEKELDLLIATEMSGDGDSVAEELRSVGSNMMIMTD